MSIVALGGRYLCTTFDAHASDKTCDRQAPVPFLISVYPCEDRPIYIYRRFFTFGPGALSFAWSRQCCGNSLPDKNVASVGLGSTEGSAGGLNLDGSLNERFSKTGEREPWTKTVGNLTQPLPHKCRELGRAQLSPRTSEYSHIHVVLTFWNEIS